MFFFVAKVFWFFIQPLNLALFLFLAGIVALFLGRRSFSLAASCAAFLIVALGTWTSLGALMLNPLEERFQRPTLPDRVDGVVLLGGGLEGAINLARGGYELNAGGDRLVETAILARRFPEALIVISGGTGTLILDGEGDADTAPRLLTALGVEPERLVLENKSRDTFENAQFTKALVSPKPGETWLLVTSAFHMPRSMALFRKADFAVLPWPVDYRTSGFEGVGFAQDNPADSLRNLTTAIREWIGLAAYWLSGRIETPFPGPM
jgi:uncharacterized SAM-binding protein YcdF (DUF218 family)